MSLALLISTDSALPFGWDLAQATYVSTRIHSDPQAFGKVMSALKPRLAVGYHSVHWLSSVEQDHMTRL